MTTQQSSSFFLLDDRIQRYLWAEQWESLRDAQEVAIPLIVNADRDVIVAAATATGKTEAAFLPALTNLLQRDASGLIVYISPLKALINDQFGRLGRLCESLDMPVWPWHGDISATIKRRFLSNRHGVLLITPESLEALLCNRGTAVSAVFAHTSYFIIDELHAFIGTERGKQLQSLMHRIAVATQLHIPRVGLSATLGDMRLAADFMRPGNGAGVEMVISKSSETELKILVKGFEEPVVMSTPKYQDENTVDDGESPEPLSPSQIAAHLFNSLRGSNNLVFPNSRREVERYTYLLNKMCSDQQVPNEFWPHHGNLSKELRTETEAALKQKEYPATAICTNTLELGIDIGAVKSVAQIGPPPSVASLRQRLGRSGRRKGEPAILRGYNIEEALGGKPSLASELRLDTIQTIAMISLLLEGWFEPPPVDGLHLSTLIQQMLSLVAQYGGASIGQLYACLCAAGCPFQGVSKDEFIALIRHLGQKDLLVQNPSGVLLHGSLGEKFVNHFSFYAAFAADDEYRLVCAGKTLGTLPVSQMLMIGQHILFGGRTWRVDEVDDAQRTIVVSRTVGGRPPVFEGGGGRTHSNVRQRMRSLLASIDVPPYLDTVACRFLSEGRSNYKLHNLDTVSILDQGSSVLVLTWLGDSVNEALVCLLMQRRLEATTARHFVEVQKGGRSTRDILNTLIKIGLEEPPSAEDLLLDAHNIQREKWDWALPDTLLRRAYASQNLDLAGACRWMQLLGAGSIR